MNPVGEPQDSVPADGGTMQLRAQPEDAPPAPQDAIPTVRLPTEPEAVPTVRLPGGPEAVPTVRLPAEPEAAPTPTLQVAMEPQAVPAPTPAVRVSVDPAVVEVPAPQTAPIAAPEVSGAAPDPGLIRFGPGVPDPKTARTIAVWKGEVAPEPEAEEKQRRRGWLFWVPVVLVFLALLGWWLDGLLAPPPLKITGASVQATPATVSCDGKGTVIATVTIDGRAGSFHYRWLRNDGTASGLLTETVAAGARQVRLPLIWTFSGPGTFDARATLQIEGHPDLTTAATFSYSCAA